MTIMTLARAAAWILVISIVVLSLVPPNWRPITDFPHFLEHFGIYVITGLAFGIGYRRKEIFFLILPIFAGAIELAQLLVPGRHARISDFVIDALAMCIGLTVTAIGELAHRTNHKEIEN
jgi:VanZ family protein